MMPHNHVALDGCLIKEPELRFAPSNRPVLSFLLDVPADSTNIVPVQVWDSLAEFCFARLKNGSHIYLEGELLVGNKTEVNISINFEGETIEIPENRYSVRVIAKKVEILE